MNAYTKKCIGEIVSVRPNAQKCCLATFLRAVLTGRTECNGKITVPCTDEVADYIIEILHTLFKKKADKFVKTDGAIVMDADLIEMKSTEGIESDIAACKKESCADWYLRGLVLTRGNITDPTKEYRVELFFASEALRNDAAYLLAQIVPNGRYTARGGKYVIYFKDGESYQDILARVGAQNASFSAINLMIEKQYRANANRARNCDSGNIRKQLAATEKYVKAIRFLQQTDAFSQLTEDMQETALLRLEDPSATLTEIGSRCRIPLSKSGVSHRLDKILKIAEELQSQQ